MIINASIRIEQIGNYPMSMSLDARDAWKGEMHGQGSDPLASLTEIDKALRALAAAFNGDKATLSVWEGADYGRHGLNLEYVDWSLADGFETDPAEIAAKLTKRAGLFAQYLDNDAAKGQ